MLEKGLLMFVRQLFDFSLYWRAIKQVMLKSFKQDNWLSTSCGAYGRAVTPI
jgi:hypothetical protein